MNTTQKLRKALDLCMEVTEQEFDDPQGNLSSAIVKLNDALADDLGVSTGLENETVYPEPINQWLNDFITYLDKHGFDFDSSEHLDELVHEAKSGEASDINNEGIESQVKYLIEVYGLPGFAKLKEGIYQALDIDDAIIKDGLENSPGEADGQAI